MSFLRHPEDLEEALQPKLAKKVLLNLRVYVVSVLHEIPSNQCPSHAISLIC